MNIADIRAVLSSIFMEAQLHRDVATQMMYIFYRLRMVSSKDASAIARKARDVRVN